jgi:hypothetical protein
LPNVDRLFIVILLSRDVVPTDAVTVPLSTIGPDHVETPLGPFTPTPEPENVQDET